MAQRKPPSSASDPLGDSDDFTEFMRTAREKLGEGPLRALVVGYIAGRQAFEISSEPAAALRGREDAAELTDSAMLSADPLDDYAMLTLDGDLARARPSPTVGGPTENADLKFRSDATGFITQSIFAVFSGEGIPVTMNLAPNSVMSQGKWVSLGRAIFARIARRYPQFTPHAAPSNLIRFYERPLIELAKAIRAVL